MALEMLLLLSFPLSWWLLQLMTVSLFLFLCPEKHEEIQYEKETDAIVKWLDRNSVTLAVSLQGGNSFLTYPAGSGKSLYVGLKFDHTHVYPCQQTSKP